MLVQDIMTTDIVTCDVNVSLQTAAERMLAKGVGSVIVTRDGDPAGILTETDALRAGAATERPFSEIPIEKIAHSPLVTASKGETVRNAIQRMQDKKVKKLPVIEDLTIVGIVTQTDIRSHYSSFIHEAHALEQQHSSWSTDERSKLLDE